MSVYNKTLFDARCIFRLGIIGMMKRILCSMRRIIGSMRRIIGNRIIGLKKRIIHQGLDPTEVAQT